MRKKVEKGEKIQKKVVSLIKKGLGWTKNTIFSLFSALSFILAFLLVLLVEILKRIVLLIKDVIKCVIKVSWEKTKKIFRKRRKASHYRKFNDNDYRGF